MDVSAQPLGLSRRETDRLPGNARIETALATAIEVTAVRFSAHARYDRQLRASLSLCGPSLIALMSEDDEPLLPLPVRLSRSDAPISQPGFVLTLRDRALAAWTEGRLRPRYFARPIPYSTVRTAERQVVAGAYDGSIVVTADETWTFDVPSMFEDRSIVQTLLRSFLGADASPTAPR